MPRTSTPSPADLPSPSARHLPRVRRGDGWDALADIEVFVFAVEAELEAMERERIGVHRGGCRGRSKFRPLRRHRMKAWSTDNPKGQKALNACVTWNFRSTRSEPVTAAVAGFSSAAWPEFEPPFTRGR